MNESTEIGEREQKELGASGLSRFGKLAKDWALGMLRSPRRMARRLDVDEKAREVAYQIASTAKNRAEEGYADEVLDSAWKSYGSESFEVALGMRSWSLPMSTTDNDLWLLCTPAQMVMGSACSAGWTKRLASMVPDKNWQVRTKASQSWFRISSERLNKTGVRIKSLSPLAVLCSRDPEKRGYNESELGEKLALTGDRIESPSGGEAHVLRMLLGIGSRRDVFEAWMEKKELLADAESMPKGARKSARAAKRL